MRSTAGGGCPRPIRGASTSPSPGCRCPPPAAPPPAGTDKLGRVSDPRDPVADLRRIAFLLERTLESSYRVKAFRTAAAALAALPPDDVRLLAETGGLRGIKGIGERTAAGGEQAGARGGAGEPGSPGGAGGGGPPRPAQA